MTNAASRMKAEYAKTPTSRLKDARVKYHHMKLPARVNITQLEQRKQMLIKLLSPCNAYDENTDTFHLNALCYMHQTRLDGRDDFDPPNYDRDVFPEHARTQFHLVCAYRFPHQMSDLANSKSDPPLLVAYIGWTAFLQNVKFLILSSAPLRDMEISNTPTKKDLSTPCNMIRDRETPTLYYSFDLRHAGKHDYRAFYIQKGRMNVPSVKHRILNPVNKADPVTSLWFSVTDLVRFYNNCVVDDVVLENTYATFKQHHQLIYDHLRSIGTIRLIEDTDFIQSPTFDIEFLRLINSPFAQRICAVLYPVARITATTSFTQPQSYSPRREDPLPAVEALPPRADEEVTQPSADSVDAITTDFIALIEKEGIYAYYSKDEDGQVKHIYELKRLTEFVVGPPTSANDHKNRWKRTWNRSELKLNSLIWKFGDTYLMEVQRFLVWCLHARFTTDIIVTQKAKSLKERLDKLEPQITDYPAMALKVSEDQLAVEDETHSEQEAILKIRQQGYANRFLEVNAARHNPPFLRCIFGEHDNLWVPGELAKVAGPYSSLQLAHKAVEPYLNGQPSQQGLVVIEFGSKKEYLCTHGKNKVSLLIRSKYSSYVDYFLVHLWDKLGNDTKPKYCKIALTLRAVRIASGTAADLGSKLIEDTVVANRARIAALPEGIERTSQLHHCEELERSISEMDLRFAQQPTETLSGFVYAVTSPLLNAVKIGQWSGSEEQLRYRYTTYYGRSCQIIVKKVDDRKACERETHKYFASYNLRSDATTNGELFEKSQLETYTTFIQSLEDRKEDLVVIRSSDNNDSIESITTDFIAMIEEQGINAYYFQDEDGHVKHIYELKRLTEFVVGPPTSAEDHKTKWRRSWNRSELTLNKLIWKFGDTYLIEVERFVVWCLHARFTTDIVNQNVKSLQERLDKLEPQITDYPAMEVSEEQIAVEENATYSEEEAVLSIRQQGYANRYLEINAARHNPRFIRRIFAEHDNLWVPGELAKIAGPYKDIRDAVRAIAPYLSTDTGSGIAELGPVQGLVSIRDPDSDHIETLVTIDYFRRNLWNKLGDDSKPQFCKVALAYRAGAFNTDNRVQAGSAQVVEEAMQNAQRLQTNATAEEVQQRTETLAQLEDEAAVSQLKGNAAADVRTVTDPSILQAVAAVQKSEALLMREMELESSKCIREMELKSAETIEKARAEADGKAREEEARARQSEAEARARQEEALARARQTEAIAKAREEEAKARAVKAEASKAEWDPNARVAEANARETESAMKKAEFELRKTRLNQGLSEDGSAAAMPPPAPQPLAGPIGNLVIDLPANHAPPSRCPSKKRTRRAGHSNRIRGDAFIPKSFNPPAYSDACTRPRRGVRVNGDPPVVGEGDLLSEDKENHP